MGWGVPGVNKFYLLLGVPVSHEPLSKMLQLHQMANNSETRVMSLYLTIKMALDVKWSKLGLGEGLSNSSSMMP